MPDRSGPGAEDLATAVGQLEGHIDGDAHERVATKLTYQLQLELSEATWGGGRITLVFPAASVRSWREFPNRELIFPLPPRQVVREGAWTTDDQDVDASFESAGHHTRLWISDIVFGPMTGGQLTSRIRATKTPGDRPLLTIEATLAVGSVWVRGDVSAVPPMGPDEQYALAGEYLDLRDYRRREWPGTIELVPDLQSGG